MVGNFGRNRCRGDGLHSVDTEVSVDATGRCFHIPPPPRTAVSFLGGRHTCIDQYAIAHVGADLFVATPAAHGRS